MIKEIILLALCSMLFAPCSSAEAQHPTRIPRIGFLTGIDRTTGSTRFEEFRLALRELGYIEGENIAIEYRNSEGSPTATLSLQPSWCASK